MYDNEFLSYRSKDSEQKPNANGGFCQQAGSGIGVSSVVANAEMKDDRKKNLKKHIRCDRARISNFETHRPRSFDFCEGINGEIHLRESIPFCWSLPNSPN